MAEILVEDLIDQASYTITANGPRATRKFIVKGLSDAGHRRLFQASLIPDVPVFGALHPSIPNLICGEIHVTPVASSPSMAWLLATYGSPESSNIAASEVAVPELEVGSTLANIETSSDAFGDEMILNHSTTSVDPDTGEVITKDLPPQPGKVSVQEAMPYISLSRREPKPFNIAKIFDAVGSINSVAWGFDRAAHTWLCASIRAKLEGEAFRVAYEFQYRRRTWDSVLTYTDPSTGAPVANPVEGVGKKTFQIYPDFDFSVLNLGI